MMTLIAKFYTWRSALECSTTAVEQCPMTVRWEFNPNLMPSFYDWGVTEDKLMESSYSSIFLGCCSILLFFSFSTRTMDLPVGLGPYYIGPSRKVRLWYSTVTIISLGTVLETTGSCKFPISHKNLWCKNSPTVVTFLPVDDHDHKVLWLNL